MKLKVIFILLLAVSIFAAQSKVDINKIRKKYNPQKAINTSAMQQIKKELGSPKKVDKTGNTITWYYDKKCIDGSFKTECLRFKVHFVKGKFFGIYCDY